MRPIASRRTIRSDRPEFDVLPTLRTAGRTAARLGFGIAALVAAIFATAATPRSVCACTTYQKAYAAAMKADLRDLVTAQEAFYADSARYTASINDLYALGYTFAGGVELVSLSARTNAFEARVRFPSRTEQECWLAVGPLPDGVNNPFDGEPQCEPIPEGAVDPLYFVLLFLYVLFFALALLFRLGRAGRGLPPVGPGTYIVFFLLAVLQPFWAPLRENRSCLDPMSLHLPAVIMIGVVMLWMAAGSSPTRTARQEDASSDG